MVNYYKKTRHARVNVNAFTQLCLSIDLPNSAIVHSHILAQFIVLLNHVLVYDYLEVFSPFQVGSTKSEEPPRVPPRGAT